MNVDRPTKSILEDLNLPDVDQSAETIQELVSESGMSRSWIEQRCKANVEAGRWERVRKRVNNKPVTAYRRVQ